MKKAKAKARVVKVDRDGLTRCRICGCTETDACLLGCSWVQEDLCSTCAKAVDAIAEWQEVARRANVTALMREVKALAVGA